MALLDKKLTIFRTAALLRHFSEAASILGMSQPNVTQQIALLEKEMQTPLFDRSQRQLNLTPAGEALLKECDTLFRETAEIHRRIQNASSRIHHYKIGGTMTAGGYLLPALVTGYMKTAPSHHLGIHIANTREISDLLKSRSLDLGLVEGPFDRKYFLWDNLCRDELFAFAAPGMLDTVFSLQEYIQKGGRFILRESGSGTRQYFDLFLKKQGIAPPSPDQILEVNSFDAIKLLVRSGEGITIMSPLAAADEETAGCLKRSVFREGNIERTIDFIYLANESRNFVRRFISFCKQPPDSNGKQERNSRRHES